MNNVITTCTMIKIVKMIAREQLALAAVWNYLWMESEQVMQGIGSAEVYCKEKMNAGIFVFWSTDVAVYEMVVLIGTRVGEVNTIDGITTTRHVIFKT